MKKVSHDLRFDVFKCSVNVSDMNTTFLHKLHLIVIAHWNNDLLPWQALYSHVDSWLRFTIIFDNFLYIFNFFCLKIWKYLLDFKNFPCVIGWKWCLCIQFSCIFLSICWIILLEKFWNLINFFGQFGQNRKR